MGLGRMRRGRWFARLLAMVLAVPLTWIGWNQATYNFAVLQPGRIYRSGQMSPSALLRTLREHEVKTVRAQLAHYPDRLVAIERLGHDLHIHFVVEYFTDATSEKRLIVDDQNTEGRRHLTVVRTFVHAGRVQTNCDALCASLTQS